MLSSFSRAARGSTRVLLRSVAAQSRRMASSFDRATSFDTFSDFGSYRNSMFTHRLPESTAEQSPDLVALHARLSLPKEFSYSTLSQSLNMVNAGDGLANNFGLSTVGKLLLSYYVSEHLLITYPRLPMPIHNLVVNAYMGDDLLYEVGKGWGIQVERDTKLDQYLAHEPFYMKYGRLRYLNDETLQQPTEAGIERLSRKQYTDQVRYGNYVSQVAEAYASSVRAIVGGLYTQCGEEAAKTFIQQQILSRRVPLEQMFQFLQPTRELVRLAEKLGFEEPIEVRLLSETGRLSESPIFVTGVFSGVEKLGEGVGSSIREAKTRAVVNALLGYYLYLPMSSDGSSAKSPSDLEYKYEDGVVGLGDVAI